MTWEEYARRVSERLGGFHRSDATADKADFTRSLPGDTHTLRIERLSPGPPLRVRVTFLSAAS